MLPTAYSSIGLTVPQKTGKYTAISLFAGAGGLDVGFERAGFEVVFANELDADAANTWKANRSNSDVMHQGDLLDYLESLKDFKGTDIVFGGPPCQGFSVAGKMNPDDPRSKLIWSFMDAVNIVQPRVFVIENVRALAKLSRWKETREGIVSRAKRMGYDCSYEVFSACDFGVPQNRERVVFFGIKNGLGSADDLITSMASFKSEPETLRAVLLSADKYGTEENPQTCTSHVSLAINPVIRKSPYAGMLVNGAGRPMDLDGAAHTLPASMGGNKTPIIDQAALESNTPNWFVQYHERIIAGETSPEDEVIPDSIRRLTVKEAALLQTFPANYVFSGKKTAQYKQIGNAVACNFAYAVARAVSQALKIQSKCL